MKDLCDIFNDNDYSKMVWDDNDMLVPTSDIVDKYEDDDYMQELDVEGLEIEDEEC